MRRITRITIGLCFLVALAGCQRLGIDRPAALPAAPTEPVDSEPLKPLDLTPDTANTENPEDPNADGTDENDEVKTADPFSPDDVKEPRQSAKLDIGRTDLLGGWKVTSDEDTCQLFMTLTTWSGGYRATTKGCGSAVLTGISAWDLNGKQVLLKDASGGTMAVLYPTGAEKFNGRTNAKTSISIYR